MPTFRIVRAADPPVIVCEACREKSRYWDERAASRWKSAHYVNCPANYRPERSPS